MPATHSLGNKIRWKANLKRDSWFTLGTCFENEPGPKENHFAVQFPALGKRTGIKKRRYSESGCPNGKWFLAVPYTPLLYRYRFWFKKRE